VSDERYISSSTLVASHRKLVACMQLVDLSLREYVVPYLSFTYGIKATGGTLILFNYTRLCGNTLCATDVCNSCIRSGCVGA
jgi:hypothetical protein